MAHARKMKVVPCRVEEETIMDTQSDRELIDELASRHDELIVIRPKASNVAGDDKLVIFCKTNVEDGGYDIMQASELLHDALRGLMDNSLVEKDD